MNRSLAEAVGAELEGAAAEPVPAAGARAPVAEPRDLRPPQAGRRRSLGAGHNLPNDLMSAQVGRVHPSARFRRRAPRRALAPGPGMSLQEDDPRPAR